MIMACLRVYPLVIASGTSGKVTIQVCPSGFRSTGYSMLDSVSLYDNVLVLNTTVSELVAKDTQVSQGCRLVQGTDRGAVSHNVFSFEAILLNRHR